MAFLFDPIMLVATLASEIWDIWKVVILDLDLDSNHPFRIEVLDMI